MRDVGASRRSAAASHAAVGSAPGRTWRSRIGATPRRHQSLLAKSQVSQVLGNCAAPASASLDCARTRRQTSAQSNGPGSW